MTLADQAAFAGHDGQVTSGKPDRPKRRSFTAAAYKARILAEYDALPDRSPQRGELMRRERLSSLLKTLAEDKRFELLRVSPTRFQILLLTVRTGRGCA